MNEEAFKIKLKFHENSYNKKIFYCDKDQEGRTLINIGYGFNLSPGGIFSVKNIWKNFSVDDFCWNELYIPRRTNNDRTPPNTDDVEKNFKLAYDGYWTFNKNSLIVQKSEVRIKSDIKIDLLFEKKYSRFREISRNWYNEASETHINSHYSVGNERDLIASNMLYSSEETSKVKGVIYPTWETLPDDFKWVIIDICYNAGPGSVEYNNGLRKYVSLRRAFKTANFDLALQHSDCGISVDRNFFKRQLIYNEYQKKTIMMSMPRQIS